MNKRLMEIAGFILAILVFFVIFKVTLPPAKSLLSANDGQTKNLKTVYYTALGDSLTEGVGDSTKEGGFVPLLAKLIENKDNTRVKYDNYGKAGDTSTQIYKRLVKQTEIQEALKKADVITITVGGNDLIKTFSSNLADLKVSTFSKAQLTYQKNLKKLLTEVNKYKKADTVVYVLGIYNPFYLAFGDISNLQTIFDNWNQASQEIIRAEKNYYFVPINDLLYKGSGVAEASSGTAANDLLSQYDEFHPNNVGYNIMAKAVFDAYEVNN